MKTDKHSSCCGGHNAATRASAGAPVDPVCKMTVDPATAKNKFEHADQMYYFCCPGCLKKFAAEPGKYL